MDDVCDTHPVIMPSTRHLATAPSPGRDIQRRARAVRRGLFAWLHRPVRYRPGCLDRLTYDVMRNTLSP